MIFFHLINDKLLIAYREESKLVIYLEQITKTAVVVSIVNFEAVYNSAWKHCRKI